MRIDRLLYWIFERECIRLRREGEEPKPWTDDPIFQKWAFTNVRREHDRVTKWIATNWREPHADDPDLWFAMTVARFVNEPDTLAEIGFPVPWNHEHFLDVMASRKARKLTVYRAAYMIRADNRPPGERYGSTPQYQAADVFDPLWRDRRELRPQKGETLAHYHHRLGKWHGLGDGFMSAQVIADLKYAPPLKSAEDWFDFAVSGPGSRRGLNRVIDRPAKEPWKSEAEWRREFDRLREAIRPDLEEMLGGLDAQNLQNCCCEWDKHERVRLGEGKPRRRFNGTGSGGDLLQGFHLGVTRAGY